MSETINSVIDELCWAQVVKRTAEKNMSPEKSLGRRFSFILQRVGASNDYTDLVVATVVVRIL